MDTCIVMPKELNLKLLPFSEHSIFEMGVSLWAKKPLNPGVTFRADEGEVTLDKLEVYSSLHPHDVRRYFGGMDEMLKIDNRTVRHCNWVRFLRASRDFNQVNMVARLVHDQPTFQVVRRILPNDELKVFFAGASVYGEVSKMNATTSDVANISQQQSPVLENTKLSSSSSNTKSFLSVFSHSSGFFESPTTRDHSRVTSSDEFQPLDLRFRCEVESSGNESDIGSERWKDSPKKFDSEETSSTPVIRRRCKTWLPCEACGKKFDRPSLLKRHIRTHTGEKPHSCDVCGKAFSTSSSLNTHKRIHSGERPHECPVCGKRFTASSNLYYHRMTHKKEKPHKCSICSKSFPTPGDLKSHQYTHSGTWPFKCDICARGFSKMANLKNHIAVHAGADPKSNKRAKGVSQDPCPFPRLLPSTKVKSFTIESIFNDHPSILCSSN